MRARLSLALAALLVLGAVSARADRRADERAISALYGRLKQAMVSKDVRAVMATGTRDFHYVRQGRSMAGKQAEAMMRQEFAMTASVDRMDMDIRKMDIQGSRAVVETADRYAMVTKPDRQGKSHRIAGSGRSVAHLVKQGGVWRFDSVEEIDGKMTMDGRPFDPTTAQPPSTSKDRSHRPK